jgi:hypothetical protein
MPSVQQLGCRGEIVRLWEQLQVAVLYHRRYGLSNRLVYPIAKLQILIGTHLAIGVGRSECVSGAGAKPNLATWENKHHVERNQAGCEAGR